jgi:glucose-6-phosphate-specific signal transduction histidine kinase
MRGTVMYWALLPFAIVGAVILRRRRRLVWPLVATAMTVTLVAAATYGQQRFRIAAEPALLVLAAVALHAAWQRVRRARANSLPARVTG